MASSFVTIAGSSPAGLTALWAAMEFGHFFPANPKGISPQSPGLERSDYPGWTIVYGYNPNGVAPATGGRNPFRVEMKSAGDPG